MNVEIAPITKKNFFDLIKNFDLNNIKINRLAAKKIDTLSVVKITKTNKTIIIKEFNNGNSHLNLFLIIKIDIKKIGASLDR